MSKIYDETYSYDVSIPDEKVLMRKHSQRPGKSDPETGLPVYITEQAHKDQCDINKIVPKYDKTGLINHISDIEAQYGDVSGLDFKMASDQVIGAQQSFDKLPSHIRKRFKNSPQEFLSFFDDPLNRPEAISLGLINSSWTDATDGLGEHVKKGDNIPKAE